MANGANLEEQIGNWQPGKINPATGEVVGLDVTISGTL